MNKKIMYILISVIMFFSVLTKGCDNIKQKYDNPEIFFYGKIIETSSSNLIVEPLLYEEERMSSDRFSVRLKNNDSSYDVGDYIKVFYDGNILETYYVQIDATKIEIVKFDDFDLKFYPDESHEERLIIDKHESNLYNYNIYTLGGTAEVIIDNHIYSLEKALKDNIIDMDKIIAKATFDFPNAISYDDGGSTEYSYNNYTIIKLHTLSRNQDVYIGDKNFRLNDIKK